LSHHIERICAANSVNPQLSDVFQCRRKWVSDDIVTSIGCEVSDRKRENKFIKPFDVLAYSLDFQGKTVYLFGLVTACQQSQGLNAWGIESGRNS
jgi:hypothetical protein